MHDMRVGSAFRALRLRRGWRQIDLARRSGVSQSAISDIELGRVGATTIDTLRRVAKSLDMRVEIIARWRGGDLDRLLNARHATLATAVAAYLQTLGWEVAPEVSFSIYGERGSIDILAWHEVSRTLLVVEVKTELIDVYDTLGVLDRKTRLAPAIARARGWRPRTVGSWLALAEGSTNRHRVEQFGLLLRGALPAGRAVLKAWLRAPAGSMAALTFFSGTGGSGAKQEMGGRKRVRVPRPLPAERDSAA